MKNLTIIFTLILISFFSYAQWQTNGNDIFYNNGNVGIGLTNPQHKLEIEGTVDVPTIERALVKLKNNSLSPSSLVGLRLYAGANDSFTTLTHCSETYTATPNMANYTQLYNNGAGLILRANGGILRFETGLESPTIERMRIDETGNVGVGTVEPKAKVHVADGDIYISDIDKGIIMKSPDGQCWRGTIDNSGQLIFNPVPCPELSTGNNNSLTEKIKEVSVFPNPSKNYISIKFNENDFESLKYSINNVDGKLLLEGIIGSSNEKINVS